MDEWFPKQKASPFGLPWLAISNVRGHLVALETVLDEVASLPMAGIVAGGDHCLGGPAPFETWCRLRELGVHMVRGKTDLALGTLNESAVTFSSLEDEHQWQTFLAARNALGDVICRRLAELPKTEVVSLDDKSGIMVQHVLPAEERRGPYAPVPTEAQSDDDLQTLTHCVAEDVLVYGAPTSSFVRSLQEERSQRLLVVAPGAIGEKIVDDNENQGPVRVEELPEHVAQAVLIQAFSDGKVRAAVRRFSLPKIAMRNFG